MRNWRTSFIHRHKRGLTVAALALGVAAAALLSLCLGAEEVSARQVLLALFGGEDGTAAARIVRYVRLPRTCAGVLANSLAAPSTVGVNSGAGFAVAICCALFPTALNLVPFAALAGAFGGALLVLLIAERTGASKITLVLAGIAISNIFSAGVDAVVTFVPEALNGYSDFRIGGFSGISMSQLFPACWLILGGLAVAISLHNELDVLLLGQEQAQSLGLPAKRLRLIFLILTAMLAGSAVSFSGLLGFVGLVVPHMMRRIVGGESGLLLTASALGGAAMLCTCDLLARILFAPYELPVGIVMSLVGGPFFICLLMRQRGGRLSD